MWILHVNGQAGCCASHSVPATKGSKDDNIKPGLCSVAVDAVSSAVATADGTVGQFDCIQYILYIFYIVYRKTPSRAQLPITLWWVANLCLCFSMRLCCMCLLCCLMLSILIKQESRMSVCKRNIKRVDSSIPIDPIHTLFLSPSALGLFFILSLEQSKWRPGEEKLMILLMKLQIVIYLKKILSSY